MAIAPSLLENVELPLYQRVADRVSGLISGGTLRPGERIPSVRRLAKQLGVSVTTVLEAYRVLEDRGLVEARPQSGYYVRPPVCPAPTPEKTHSCPSPSLPEVSDHVVVQLRTAGRRDLVPFGCATPSQEFLPTAQLNRILARVVRQDPLASQTYDHAPGHEGFRVQIARRAMDAGCSITPDDIVTTSGAQEALGLCLRAVANPGDTIAIESPTYWGLIQILEAHGLRAIEVATDPDTGMCLDELTAVLDRERVAAVVAMPSFGNPLGHDMPESKRRLLVELLADRGIPVIEDDVYGDLPFVGPRPKALKAFDRTGNVLLCSSLSKSVAPGYRGGWAIPGRYQERVERWKFAASIATATATQMALAAYLETGGFDRHLRRLRRIYKDLVGRMARKVAETFPDGTRVTRPHGGHVLWVEMPSRVDALRLYGEALEARISTLPGPLFSATGRYRNCLRINCAVPWTDRVEGAVETLGALAGKQIA